MSDRPPLDKNISIPDFKDFYWLKAELISFCKRNKLPSSGSKQELNEVIIQFLSGSPTLKKTKKRQTPSSNFDWRRETLHMSTIITDNYSNTENVRHFFQEQLGQSFKFNVAFMNWMKSNKGKTLGDAIHAWKNIKEQQKSQTGPKDIAPQFEYNRYLRDFLADNPSLDRQVGITLWKIKKSKRGTNAYERKDLQWL